MIKGRKEKRHTLLFNAQRNYLNYATMAKTKCSLFFQFVGRDGRDGRQGPQGLRGIIGTKGTWM